MRTAAGVILGCLSMLTVSGCRATTQVKAVPRVDLAVENQAGNRGYITGTPPPPKALKTTRQMFETLIEIPGYARGSTQKPSANKKPSRIADSRSEQTLADYPPIESTAFKTPEEYDTYVAKKGDSLWSIAAKANIYGKATLWRNIYEANRDRLKNPDSVKPGMELRIPRGAAENFGTTNNTEGSVFKK